MGHVPHSYMVKSSLAFKIQVMGWEMGGRFRRERIYGIPVADSF